MKPRPHYKSISVNLFNVWKIFFWLLLFPSILLFIEQERTSLIPYFAILCIILSIIYIVLSYSHVSYDGQVLRIKNLLKEFQLDRIEEIKTWWCYDFGISTIEYTGEGTEGKTRAHVNKMNIYVKFISEDKVAYIYEQIHLGNKFPNNHAYLPNEEIDQTKLVKVWDIDNCLKKIRLEQNPNILKTETTKTS